MLLFIICTGVINESQKNVLQGGARLLARPDMSSCSSAPIILH